MIKFLTFFLGSHVFICISFKFVPARLKNVPKKGLRPTTHTHTYIGHLGSPPHTHTEVKESVICFNIKCVTNCKKYERVVQCLMRTHFVTNEGVPQRAGRSGGSWGSRSGEGIEHVSWQIAMGRLQNIAGNWAKMQKKKEWKQFGLFSRWIVCHANRFESGTKLVRHWQINNGTGCQTTLWLLFWK